MMATRQSVLFATVMFLILGCAQAIQPKSAPATPNYCSRFICLEVDRLSDGDTTVETVSQSLETHITINTRYGKTLLAAAAHSNCNPEPRIRLERNIDKYQGAGCVAGPETGAVRINVTFIPIVTPEDKTNPVGFPVLGVWAVDETPMSFWERGYSLRLGSATVFGW